MQERFLRLPALEGDLDGTNKAANHFLVPFDVFLANEVGAL